MENTIQNLMGDYNLDDYDQTQMLIVQSLVGDSPYDPNNPDPD